MIEATSDTGAPRTQASAVEDKSFTDILKKLLGQTVSVVNPESYHDAPVGHQIGVGFYRAKLIGLGRDYLILHTNFASVGRTGKTIKEEPVKQYVPLGQVKRVSVMKDEIILHL